MTSSDRVRAEADGPVMVLTLDRPEKLNAISPKMIRALEEHIVGAEGSPDVRALVLRGEGPSFCTGADLGLVTDVVEHIGELRAFMHDLNRVFTRLAESPVPSIAAVHGRALAGGFELMQACDLAVVADDAVLADQHANYGLIPGGGGSQRLPRLIGERRAKWLIFSGEPMPPLDAQRAGLVNEVRPPADVVPRAMEMAHVLARHSPTAIANAKLALRVGLAAGNLRAAIEVEQLVCMDHMRSRDAHIGLEAFASRSAPEFVGE